MRADAKGNRERIIAAARSALQEERTPSMVEVGRAAGVGQGTLYRHFPSWEDLLIAVHLEDMNRLNAAAPALLAEHGPGTALRTWLEMLGEYGRLKHGLNEAMHLLILQRSPGDSWDLTPFNLLIDAAKAAGEVRPDVSGYDLLLLVGFFWRMELTDERDARSAKLLDVVLAGLRPQHSLTLKT